MKTKPILTLIAIIALITVLTGGAFTAMQLLAADDSQSAVSASGGIRVMESVIDDGNGPVSVRTKILPAEELPNEQAAAGGVLISRADNTLIIGTGNINLEVDISVDPSTGQEDVTLIPSTDGPQLEVVVGVDTILYNDVTDLTSNAPAESGEREVTQQLRSAASLEEMPEQAELQVWGERRGDRVIASLVVFGPLGGGAFE